MSYFVTKYPHGTFSWADFYSTDMAASTKFYDVVFGWTSEAMPTGEGRPDYTMFSLAGKRAAGGSQMDNRMQGVPSFWNNYVTVDNVDEMVEKVTELGGEIMLPPMDVMGTGRMMAIKDPTGATLVLWQAGTSIGAEVVNTVGAMGWNELYTPDAKKAQEFYGKLLGWTFEEDDGASGMPGYISIKNNGRWNGGIIQLSEEMKQMPPCWIPYFTVQSVSESCQKATELGGKVMMPLKDIGMGKIAMIADPTGANTMIIEMMSKPEEWMG